MTCPLRAQVLHDTRTLTTTDTLKHEQKHSQYAQQVLKLCDNPRNHHALLSIRKPPHCSWLAHVAIQFSAESDRRLHIAHNKRFGKYTVETRQLVLLYAVTATQQKYKLLKRAYSRKDFNKVQ
jgi:hypothetical protein